MENDLKATFQGDVGKQLGKHDTDEIEVLEGVPQDKREKGGIKLLEHLQRTACVANAAETHPLLCCIAH